ncbi:hypothetical protein L2E82_10869 [Cichorium intybus]|uniref:Uncharacterized protein n=1 Tax=Cichorium intybus TaxID=13427 RepID=A0ACB9GCD7_CICIN|nr:hypothetical protein L2E82_10869 [Cichorium intybus]
MVEGGRGEVNVLKKKQRPDMGRSQDLSKREISLEKKGSLKVVKVAWSKDPFSLKDDVWLLKKLQVLKSNIRIWVRDKHLKENKEMQSLLRDIDTL